MFRGGIGIHISLNPKNGLSMWAKWDA